MNFLGKTGPLYISYFYIVVMKSIGSRQHERMLLSGIMYQILRVHPTRAMTW